MISTEFSHQIPFFFESFLSKPASALPKGAQWILVFEGSFNSSTGKRDYKEVLPVPAIKTGVSFEPKAWNIEEAINTTLIKDYQETKGCI